MDSEKIKLYFYIDSRGISCVDMYRPDKGNPGVGGTQFCFLLVCYYLNLYYRDKYEINVISYEELHLPTGISNLVIKSLHDLRKQLPPKSIFVLKQTNDLKIYDILDSWEEVKVITWAHNYILGDAANRITKSNNIKANVFVGKQMYDLYIDHDIIKKSIPIYNIVPDVSAPPRILPDKPTITFMGQISESKGIIALFKVWEKVKKRHPDAILNIIGSGKLYDRNSKLGKFGITDSATEKKIEPYILDDKGELSKDINFLGIMGSEKYDIFANSTVGMVNPSARTETFGMGIIEMASATLPVVTKNWNGHPDTALDGETALLGFSIGKMAKQVCRLIEDEKLNIELGESAKSGVARFAPEKIIKHWDKLFTKLANDNNFFDRLKISHPYWNNYKFIRNIIRILRFNLGLSLIPSIVEIETIGYRILKSLMKR